MSDESQVSFSPAQEEAGQPSQPVVQEPQSGQESKPEAITKADLEALRQELSGEVTRLIQSRTDKTESRLRTAIDTKLKRLDELTQGLGIDPQVIAAARTRIEQEALLDEVMSSDGKQVAQPAQPLNKEIVEATNARARALQEKAGVFVEQADPEWSKLKLNTPNPYEFLDSLESAIQEKALRIGKQRESAPGRLSSTTAGATAGNPIGHMNDPKDLIKTWLNGGR